jgi:hypothetical protein
MSFIEAHRKSVPTEVLLINVSDIEYIYRDPQDHKHAVIRLHGDDRKEVIDVVEDYEAVKSLIAKANI